MCWLCARDGGGIGCRATPFPDVVYCLISGAICVFVRSSIIFCTWLPFYLSAYGGGVPGR